MKWRIALSILVPCLLIFVFPRSSRAEEPPWEPVAPGIDYQEFYLPDPVQIYVARMHRNVLTTTLESSIGQGMLAGGTETVSNMASRYHGAINFWGTPQEPQAWGARNQVVIAINGSFFGGDHEPPGVPWGGQIHSGWYAKRFDDLGGGSGFVWKLNRQAFIGQCVHHRPYEQLVSHVHATDPVTTTFELDGINYEREGDSLYLYTPQYASNTWTDNNGLEVLVQLERPTLVMPVPNDPRPRWVNGYIREIRDMAGSSPIPFDHVVLSAHGDARDQLLDAGIAVGDQIGINQEITDDDDCDPPYNNGNDWTKAYASIGGSFSFLIDGEVQSFPNNPEAQVRDPRTAIAFNDSYVYFIVADGRNPGVSVGLTIEQLGEFARDYLAATWGIAQDGGGSSTMVVNGRVKNNTYCNHVNCALNPPGTYRQPDPNELLEGELGEYEIFLPIAKSAFILQRQVANGMMMVVVLPKEQSQIFDPGVEVITNEYALLRLGPGSNYAPLAEIAPNTVGMIEAHFNGLDGVLAQGSYWWLVSFGGVSGWVAEENLSPLLSMEEARFNREVFLPALVELTR
jgi:hypothetical protein